jgi:uncharacterized protein YciW
MLFGHKKRLQIDLGDLQNERDRLANFLQSNFKVSITTEKNNLILDSEKLSASELHKAVTEYVHRHNLSRAYGVYLEDKTVKINRFRASEKKKEIKKGKPSQSMTQTWGL